MAPPLRLGRALLLAVAFVAYLVLAHVTTAPDQPSTPGALIAVCPYMAIALAMAWRSRHRAAALALWAALAGALAWHWPVVEARFEWLYFIQHFGTFSLLAIGFARSLLPGADPMISRFARLVHGELAAPLLRYTRGATVAWALFFGAMATASGALFFFGPLAVWSLLINLLTPLLIGAMFAAEYLCRVVVLPPTLRTGLVDSVRACVRAGRAAPPAA